MDLRLRRTPQRFVILFILFITTCTSLCRMYKEHLYEWFFCVHLCNLWLLMQNFKAPDNFQPLIIFAIKVLNGQGSLFLNSLVMSESVVSLITITLPTKSLLHVSADNNVSVIILLGSTAL